MRSKSRIGTAVIAVRCAVSPFSRSLVRRTLHRVFSKLAMRCVAPRCAALSKIVRHSPNSTLSYHPDKNPDAGDKVRSATLAHNAASAPRSGGARRRRALQLACQRLQTLSHSIASQFKEISRAYEVLMDEEMRAIYDRHGLEGLERGGGGGGGCVFVAVNFFLSFLFVCFFVFYVSFRCLSLCLCNCR